MNQAKLRVRRVRRIQFRKLRQPIFPTANATPDTRDQTAEAALLARQANTKYQMAVLNVLVVWLASIQLLPPQTLLKRAKIVLQTQTRQKPAPAAHPARAM